MNRVKTLKTVAGLAATLTVAFAVVAFIASRNYDPSSSPEVRAAHEDTQRVLEEINNEWAVKIATERESLLVLRYGESFANEHSRCRADPPKRNANQVRCQKIADRVARDDAAEELRERHDHDNW